MKNAIFVPSSVFKGWQHFRLHVLVYSLGIISFFCYAEVPLVQANRIKIGHHLDKIIIKMQFDAVILEVLLMNILEISVPMTLAFATILEK